MVLNRYCGAVILVFTVLRGVTCLDLYTSDGWFYRNYMNPPITQVPDDIPDEVVGIYINNNNISRIRANDFTGLASCTFLSLSYNSITEIEPGSFQGLDSIEDLSLFENSLSELKSGMFLGLDSLDNLVLSNNDISTINASAWAGLHNLKKLYLFGNSLTHLTFQMFFGLDSLEELTLSFNQITHMESGSFVGLHKVTRLWLDNNMIKELIFNNFVGLNSLKMLHMTINDISTIENGAFTGMQSLQKIWIDSNNIKEPRKEMFQGLENLELLNLDGNFITVVQGGVFSDLRNLKELDFENNTIVEVKPDAFRGLDKLTTSWLNENNLSTLPASVFFPLPRRLTLAMNENPLECDSRLCWLKRGEREGWVRWQESKEGRILRPDCADGRHWDAVELDCPEDVECPYPADVAHAARSESTWPFSINSRVTYTCQPCYTGGGTITCQSNNKWSEKPVCTAIPCNDPGEVENGVRIPAFGPYICGNHVTYVCNHGYTLLGNVSLWCQENGKFNGTLPKCVTDASPRTSSLTSHAKRAALSLQWLLIIVGILVLFVIIVAVVIVVLKRRGYHFCYRVPSRDEFHDRNSLESTSAGAAAGVSAVRAEGGFVNKAAMLEEEEMRYHGLQRRSDGDSSFISTASSAYSPAGSPSPAPYEPPPEYTPQSSFVEDPS